MFTARMVGAGAGFVATILIARFLGPERFGQFAILLAISNVAAGLIGPALDTTAVRFAAGVVRTDPAASYPYFGYIFRLQLLCAFGLVIGGLVLALPLRALLLSTEGYWAIPAIAVWLACFTAVGALLLLSALRPE